MERYDKHLVNTVIDITWIDERFRSAVIGAECLEGEIKAEPLTKNYSTIGTAFDYALRLCLVRLNHMSSTEFCREGEMTAEYGVRKNKRRKVFVERFWDKWLAGATVEDVLPDCITLAKLESVYRSGRDSSNDDIFYVDSDDVEDLRNLVGLIDPVQWEAHRQCVLNPVFGDSSKYIGGADADVIIDGRLVDAKATKHLKFTKEYLRQLVGYYLLNLREGDMYGIKELGVYFARHGVLFVFDAPLCVYTDAVGRKCPFTWEGAALVTSDGEEQEIWDGIESSLREYRRDCLGE